MSFKVACVQINSSSVVKDNIKVIDKYIREAAEEGAEIIFTPENSCHMVSDIESKVDACPRQEDHPAVSHYIELSKELNVYIYIGSLGIKLDSGKLANRSFLFSPDGEIVNIYDKIHLFEVKLDTGETHKESKHYEGGDRAVVAKTSLANLGMTICYDVRFPHLYRDLAKAGAEIMVVPAAFTVPTGKAHWETLLRARAIETGSFVIAVGQTGEHDGGRKTYGHSMVINPWGEVVIDAGIDVGIIYADIDLNEIDKTRKSLASLQHDREYKLI